MTCGESNCYITDDVTWPRKVKSWPQYTLSPMPQKQMEMILATMNEKFCKQSQQTDFHLSKLQKKQYKKIQEAKLSLG